MTNVPVSFRAFVLTVGLVSASASLLAQQGAKLPAASQAVGSESDPQFAIKSNVDRVVVDVVVNDSKGKPIGGLTKRGFSVYEDGKLQDILSFDVHNLASDQIYFAKLPPLPPNTFVNIATEPERGPLYVLLLDLFDIEPDDQPYARQQLLKFVDSKPEGTRFAVFVLSDSLYLIQGFTANRTLLREALDPSHPRPHVPRIFLFRANHWDLQLDSVFRAIALYLDGLPGRKNIIWYSAGFALDLFPRDDDPPERHARVTEMLDALARVNCAIYPVDVSGVQVFPAGRLTGAELVAEPSNGAPADNIVPGGSQAALIAQLAAAGLGRSPWDNYFVEDEIANFTGGRAFYSRNNFQQMLKDATEDGANYYTLTYSPSNRNFDGKMRNIAVRLESPAKDFHLEYRHGYMATAPPSPIMPLYRARKKDKDEDEANLRPIGDSLAAYMQHGAPIARQVYFRAHVKALDTPHPATAVQMANLVNQPTYFHLRHKKRPNKPLPPVTLQTYLIEYQIIARIPNLEVAAGLYDDEGRLLNGDVEVAASDSPKGPDPEAKYTYFRVRQPIDVPVTAVSLRLGVRDLSTDRMGTMEIPLPLTPETVQAPLSGAQDPNAHSRKSVSP